MKSIFFKSSFLGLVALLFLSNSSFAQGLFFERIYDETLSQASYVIGDAQTKEVIVIDPKRDIDTYLQIAEKHNLKITKITETHIHADFLSGSRELWMILQTRDWVFRKASLPLTESWICAWTW